MMMEVQDKEQFCPVESGKTLWRGGMWVRLSQSAGIHWVEGERGVSKVEGTAHPASQSKAWPGHCWPGQMTPGEASDNTLPFASLRWPTKSAAWMTRCLRWAEPWQRSRGGFRRQCLSSWILSCWQQVRGQKGGWQPIIWIPKSWVTCKSSPRTTLQGVGRGKEQHGCTVYPVSTLSAVEDIKLNETQAPWKKWNLIWVLMNE